MKMRHWSVLAILVLVAAVAGAQQPDTQAMMEAMMKAGTPGEPHKKLQPFVGTFDVTLKWYPAPGAPAMSMSGVSENQWILGGRYVEQRFRGTAMDMPFEGIGFVGYDNLKKHYVGSWVDNMSTAIGVSAGVADPSGKIMKFAMTMDDPMTGKPTPVEETIRIVTNDHHVFEMWSAGPDGKMFKMMDAEYKRKK